MELFLKEKEIGKPLWVEVPSSARHEPGELNHLVTLYVQHRNSGYGIICDDSCDDVIVLYAS